MTVSKLIVVSAVSFTQGGPLTILRDCLNNAAQHLPPNWRIVAIVHSVAIECDERIHLFPIPSAKKSWFVRLYWEWIGFYRIAKRLNPYLWVSLHDITPRLPPCRQALYCHNPAPFYRLSWREALLSPGFLAFNLFYAYLYRILIRRNNTIIVQQSWIRNEFVRRFGKLPILVAHPSVSSTPLSYPQSYPPSTVIRFSYPAFPRVFKNFEILGDATGILVSAGIRDFELYLTISGQENRYSRYIYNKFRYLPQLKFMGQQSPAQIRELYASSDAIVFPSKLETWGLPLTEAIAYNKPILAADLPYARETIGYYDLVSFFAVNSAQALAGLMADIIQANWRPSGNQAVAVNPPFFANWKSLWKYLISNDSQN
jgi:glycosyltransferase involved in cell wall biosynthesis